MSKVEEATRIFIEVRNSIDPSINPQAYRDAYFKPLKFYYENGKDEALRLLLESSDRRV